jgi:hypothetical protein
MIGEAVASIDKPFRDLYPSVDWREVKDFRNIIVHDYFGIDDTIVWDIIHLNLDQLEKDIVVILASVSQILEYPAIDIRSPKEIIYNKYPKRLQQYLGSIRS